MFSDLIPAKLKGWFSLLLVYVRTLLHLLLNKAVLIAGVSYGFRRYYEIKASIQANLEATGVQQDFPFAEIYYCLLCIGAVAVAVPILRFVLFPETAHYAEKGTLKTDINPGSKPGVTTVQVLGDPQPYTLPPRDIFDYSRSDARFTPALVHYWFATAVCVVICLGCFAVLPK